MDRIRKWTARKPSYEPLENDGESEVDPPSEDDFSWLEYSIFLLLGIAMLWAWNMFLAASPYFERRFKSDHWISAHFQSAIISVSTVTNLGSMITLSKLQKNASYPKRISSSLIINIICFTLLALSTTLFWNVSAATYFAFLMLMVAAASLATGLIQNGLFAYVTGFGRAEYTQGIMTGQAVAGVLPCIAQIASVLAVPAKEAEDRGPQESPKSAFAFFLTAAGTSTVALIAFLYLAKRHARQDKVKQVVEGADGAEEDEQTERKSVGLWTLFKKLYWLAIAVFLCFGITMVFPVFTKEIQSIRDPATAPRIFRPETFIPIALLVWNIGDLIGRLLTLAPQLSLTYYPWALFSISVARLIFIPLYFLCNINGWGAAVKSDAFYLFVVQLLFGISNGYLGSSCMMGAAEWVAKEERQAAGGFMGLMLVAGLTIGSLLSFLVSR